MERLKEMEDLDFHIPRLVVVMVALMQLGFSQTHIEAVVLLFVREIGFFLFAYIFSGLIASFLLMTLKSDNRSSFLTGLIPILINLSSGAYVLYLMLTDTAEIPFTSIQTSVFFIGASLVVTLVGTVLIGIAMLRRGKVEEVVQN